MTYEEYIELLTERYCTLELIKHLKSPKAKHDRYKHLEKINKKMYEYERKLK